MFIAAVEVISSIPIINEAARKTAVLRKCYNWQITKKDFEQTIARL